jgi:hypothetical protein
MLSVSSVALPAPPINSRAPSNRRGRKTPVSVGSENDPRETTVGDAMLTMGALAFVVNLDTSGCRAEIPSFAFINRRSATAVAAPCGAAVPSVGSRR